MYIRFYGSIPVTVMGIEKMAEEVMILFKYVFDILSLAVE
jgi:hypothetical protein